MTKDPNLLANNFSQKKKSENVFDIVCLCVQYASLFKRQSKDFHFRTRS